MMPSLLQREFLLHSQLSLHRRRVDRARSHVRAWLDHVARPYIAFSGGKDSTCILQLVREQQPHIPAVYFEGGCTLPEAEQLIAGTPNVIIFDTDEPLLSFLQRKGLDAETLGINVYGPVRRLIAQYQFDGVCYGLRAEENHGRRMHAYSRGAVFQYKRDTLWGCQPIWQWTRQDVWAFIVSQKLTYCGVYDRLWDAPITDQRLAYWAGTKKRTWGRFAWLKRNYPDLFNRFAEALPEVTAYV